MVKTLIKSQQKKKKGMGKKSKQEKGIFKNNVLEMLYAYALKFKALNILARKGQKLYEGREFRKELSPS